MRLQYYLALALAIAILNGCDKKEEVIDGKIFENLASELSGITFKNKLTETHAFNYFTYSYLYMGGGVAAGDINNDGLVDLYFTGNQVSNKLYLNKGNLQFEDITKKAGVAGDRRWYTGVTMADVNNDGFLDIYCSVSGKFGPFTNQLFMNNGDGTFTEQAKKYGLADQGNSIQATFFDYDKDGDLDAYIANYPPAPFNAPNRYYSYKMENHSYKEVDHLYRNDGGKFTDVSKQAGIAKYGLSLSAAVGDVNNDSWPDIYISNDFSTPDYFYINNGDGTFSDVLTEATAHTAFYGMGVDMADFNNDGHLDFYQPDMEANVNRRQKANMVSMDAELFWSTVQSGFHYQYMHNCLQLNSGIYKDGIPYYTNVARLTGVASTDWTWGGVFADFDNDGRKDLFVSNGTRREVSNHDYFSDLKSVRRDEFLGLSLKMPSERIDNFMFRNKGDLTFERMNDKWNISFKGFSTGATYADLDNDGDLEVITNNLDDLASVFKNKSAAIHKYVQFEIKGPSDNPNGLGTRVYVTTEDGMQMQEVMLTRGFQSSVSPGLHFGLGQQNTISEVKVVWPNGKSQVLNNLKANKKYTLSYTDAKDQASLIKNQETLLFSNAGGVFPQHRHTENTYDDFQDQVLLPHKMSNFGPALAIGDLNGDGKDDYYIGGAKGYPGTLFYQSEGGFNKATSTFLDNDKNSEDVGAVIFDADSDGDNDLFVVSGGYEYEINDAKLRDRLYINKGDGIFKKAPNSTFSNVVTSGSKAYAADFDKDGKEDLLVLGRQLPKHYPNPVSSYLFRNTSTTGNPSFTTYSNASSRLLENLGMATSAVITDFNNDGWKDIIIVGEWMPIRMYQNVEGDFVEVSNTMGLNDKTRGWWWSIAEGDFDKDGDMDYILGNNGLNYKYRANGEETFDIYFDDFDKNGKGDIVLGYYNQGTQFPVRGRECSSQQIPGIKEKFKNYESFSVASLEEVYGKEELEKSLHYQIHSFASSYLENRNGTFVLHELPKQAQLSSINQILVQDYNQDGNLDILVAGNLYASEVETPRNDASCGLLLHGDGKGGFTPVLAPESGFFTPGDVKDMATIQFNDSEYIILTKNNDDVQFVKRN